MTSNLGSSCFPPLSAGTTGVHHHVKDCLLACVLEGTAAVGTQGFTNAKLSPQACFLLEMGYLPLVDEKSCWLGFSETKAHSCTKPDSLCRYCPSIGPVPVGAGLPEGSLLGVLIDRSLPEVWQGWIS